jgi:putative ATP-binding cassette transporter
MSLFGFLLRSSGRLLPMALFGSLFAGAGGALLIVLLNESLAADLSQLPRLGVQFALLAAATLAARCGAELGFAELRHASLARLRRHVSARLSVLPYPQLEARGPGHLLGVLLQDVASVAELFSALPGLVIQGAVVLGCLSYLCWLSWKLFLIALLLVIVGSLGRHAAAQWASRHLRAARTGEDTLFVHFRALFTGAKELKLHAGRRQAFLAEQLAPSVESVRRAATRGLAIDAAASTWGNFLFFAAIGGVVFGAEALLGNEGGVQSGYALALLYMMHPMELLMEAVPEISHAAIALDRIQAAGAGFEPATASAAAAPLAPPRERASVGSSADGANFRIVLCGVTHAYHREAEKGTFRLGPIDLELEAGEIVFLVGGNGSGKTTLLKLLVGLYEPEAGSVSLDGTPISGAAREVYRQCFSAVFSDYHLFESLLGLERSGSDERAAELLLALGLSHQVSVTAGSFSTTELSTGQRKRLALLVAVLEDRPVYVFDEWAADQDPEYKRVFYEQMLPQLRARGKAVFVITHDERYFGVADRCLRLEAGQLTALAAKPAA